MGESVDNTSHGWSGTQLGLFSLKFPVIREENLEKLDKDSDELLIFVNKLIKYPTNFSAVCLNSTN